MDGGAGAADDDGAHSPDAEGFNSESSGSESEWDEVALPPRSTGAALLQAYSSDEEAASDAGAGEAEGETFSITLTAPGVGGAGGGGKRGRDGRLDEGMKRELRRLQRELLREMHQLHLMCLVARHVLCQR